MIRFYFYLLNFYSPCFFSSIIFLGMNDTPIIEGTEDNPFPTIIKAFQSIPSFSKNEYQFKMKDQLYDSNIKNVNLNLVNIKLMIK